MSFVGSFVKQGLSQKLIVTHKKHAETVLILITNHQSEVKAVRAYDCVFMLLIFLHPLHSCNHGSFFFSIGACEFSTFLHNSLYSGFLAVPVTVMMTADHDPPSDTPESHDLSV